MNKHFMKIMMIMAFLVMARIANASDHEQMLLKPSDYEYAGALYFMSPNALHCASTTLIRTLPTKKALMSAMDTKEFETCMMQQGAPDISEEWEGLRIMAGKHAADLATQ